MKKKELPEDAARREIREELGVELSDIRFLCRHYSNKEYKRDTIHCFAARPTSTDFRIAKEEIAETQWFLPSEFPQDRSSIVSVVLDACQKLAQR